MKYLKFKQLFSGSLMRRNIGMTMARQMIAAFVQLLLVVLIARQLGPEGNGFYAMAVLIPTLLAHFLNCGIGPATVYHVSRGDFSIHEAVYGNVRLAFIICAIGITIALPVLTLWGDAMFPQIPQSLLFLGLICFPILLFLAFFNTILQGLEDFKAFNASVLIPPIITLIGTFIAFSVFGKGIYGALLAYVLGQLFALGVVCLFLRKHLKSSKYQRKTSKDSSRAEYNQAVLSYGWKAHLSNVITFINYRADIFLVNFFLSPAAAGIYVIAVQISEKLWMPSQAVSTVILPRLSAMNNNSRERQRLANRGFTLVASVTVIISSVAALALYFFIGPIFGEEYKAAFPAFLCLLPGVVLWAGARVQSNCIAAAGKPEWNMYASVGVLIINISLNIFLIPKYGIVGAALATTCSYVFDALCKYFLIRRLTLLS